MTKPHEAELVRRMRDAQILSSLPAFQAAARLGSFTRAAKELGLTQGALSRRVQGLEDGLGVALFSRRGRAIAITEHGRQLAAAADEALRLIEKTRHALGGAITGTLTVGTLPSFGSLWLAPRLSTFLARHPEASVSVATIPSDFSGEHKDPVDWDPSALDVVLTLGRGGWRSLVVQPLMPEAMLAVCTPDCAARHRVRAPDDLWRMPRLAHATRADPWRSYAAHIGASAYDPDRPVRLRFEHFFMILGAARSGLGVALVPKVFVEGDLASGRMIAPFDAWDTGATYAAVSSRAALGRPIVKAFKDWLAEETGT